MLHVNIRDTDIRRFGTFPCLNSKTPEVGVYTLGQYLSVTGNHLEYQRPLDYIPVPTV